MAYAPDLFLLPSLRGPVADEFDSPFPTRPPLWSSSAAADADPVVPVFFSAASFPVQDLDSGSDYSDDEDDPAALSLDLFRRRPAPPAVDPGGWGSESSEEIDPPGCFSLGLHLGLGLEGEEEEEEETGDGVDRAVVVPDWAADDFFVGRISPSASVEFSRACPVDSGGLRVVRLDSDSDSDVRIVAMGNEQIVATGMDSDVGEDQYRISDDLDVPLRWGSLQLGDSRSDANEEFEWEEIDGHVEEGDVLTVTFFGNEERSNEMGGSDRDDAEHEDVARGIDWDVLLPPIDVDRNLSDDIEIDFEDQEGLVYTSDYESYEDLLGQFAEQDSNIKGSPPAAKSVVENLPSMVLTREDAAGINAACAVCKDGILAEERVKRLPCTHHYHEECILPWLGIRNTCPLCRFELPTDDPEYEKQKARRAGSVVSSDEARPRFDFEVLPEA